MDARRTIALALAAGMAWGMVGTLDRVVDALTSGRLGAFLAWVALYAVGIGIVVLLWKAADSVSPSAEDEAPLPIEVEARDERVDEFLGRTYQTLTEGVGPERARGYQDRARERTREEFFAVWGKMRGFLHAADMTKPFSAEEYLLGGSTEYLLTSRFFRFFKVSDEGLEPEHSGAVELKEITGCELKTGLLKQTLTLTTSNGREIVVLTAAAGATASFIQAEIAARSRTSK